MPPTASQVITFVDDKDRTPSPKCHYKSHTQKKHKKCEHKVLSKLLTTTGETAFIAFFGKEVIFQSCISYTQRFSDLQVSCCCSKCGHSWYFWYSFLEDMLSFQWTAVCCQWVLPGPAHLQQNQEAQGCWVCQGLSPQGHVLSSGYPSPSYKCCSKGAIYRDISNPERVQLSSALIPTETSSLSCSPKMDLCTC